MPDVVGYARCSTPEQDFEAQVAQVKKSASRLGLRLVDMICDPGVSGSIPLADRPQGKRLETMLRRTPAVLSTRCDRLWRQASDAAACVDRWRRLSVTVRLLDPQAVLPLDDPQAALWVHTQAALAQFDREMKNAATRTVMRTMRAERRYTGGRVPFGYTLAGDRLVPVPEDLHLVRLVQALRAEGYSMREIGQRLGDVRLSHPQAVARALKAEGVSRVA